MSKYYGRDVDNISNVEKLDNITFSGTTTYALTKSSVAYTPSGQNNILISNKIRKYVCNKLKYNPTKQLLGIGGEFQTYFILLQNYILDTVSPHLCIYR